MSQTTKNIRNIALIGSAGSGKTTFSEALLNHVGVINNKGTIEAGTTVSDFLDHEKLTQHSEEPAFLSFSHEGVEFNIIDTPGFHDYVGRSLSVLSAAETAILVVDASTGIDTSARRIFSAAREHGLCGAILINKIDSENLDLAGLLERIQLDIGSECLPVNLPASGCTAVVDCFLSAAEAETELLDVESAREKVLDQIVEVDEELMELYLEGEEISDDRKREAFEKCLKDEHLVPIFFCSSISDIGIAEILEASNRLLPSPDKGSAATFNLKTLSGESELVSTSDPTKPLLAHSVKVTVDPFKGRMGIVRIHEGSVQAGSMIYIDDDRKPFKLAHLYRLVGKEMVEIDQGKAGDICAFPRMESIQYNSVLRDVRAEERISIQPITLPTPVLGKAIQVENDKDAQKISEALQLVAIEDPSFRVAHIAALNETVIRGLGESHLRGILEGIEAQHGIKVLTDFPSIEYKETITAVADGHNRHKKQTGGAGQFGEVYLKIEPLDRGAGFDFVDEIVGGVIPGQFIPAVEKGVRQVMVQGAISGHEMQDIRVRVYDGKHHPVDSKEIAFIQAGKKAFLDAVQKARPIVMEPVVTVTVNVPSDCMGDVTGDLSSMGGLVSGSAVLADSTTDISGKVPLREMQTYHSRLSSISGGKGSYTMEFSHYAAVQPQLQKELASNFVAIEED